MPLQEASQYFGHRENAKTHNEPEKRMRNVRPPASRGLEPCFADGPNAKITGWQGRWVVVHLSLPIVEIICLDAVSKRGILRQSRSFR